MLGLILTIQIVHYPLFAEVGQKGFTTYEKLHQIKITFIVAPTMAIELITGGLLWLMIKDNYSTLILANLILLGAIWLSTALIQVPLHTSLSAGFDLDTINKLVLSNWIRTSAWALRSGILLYILYQLLEKPAALT